MTGPYHYRRADQILAEIEAANALSIQAATTLAIRAQAHATLALAAATAIDSDPVAGRMARRSGSQVYEHLLQRHLGMLAQVRAVEREFLGAVNADVIAWCHCSS